MKQGYSLKWAIEISHTHAPGDEENSRILYADKEGIIIFTSKQKARDYLRAVSGSRLGKNANPSIVRVRCKVEKLNE